MSVSNARALTRLTHWAATGEETPMYASPEQRGAEIALAATHNPQALRNPSDHAAVHLNIEWRDLTEDAWSHPVRTALGRTVPVSQTVWMRTREVWVHAVRPGRRDPLARRTGRGRAGQGPAGQSPAE